MATHANAPSAQAKANAAPAAPALKPGAARVRVDVNIRYKVRNPYLYLNTSGAAMVKETIQGLAEEGIRSMAARVDVDSFIGKKHEASNALKKRFDKTKPDDPEVKSAVGGVQSIVVGAIMSAIIVLVSLLLPNMPKVLGITTIVMAAAYFWVSLVQVPVGNGAAIKFLGKRLEGKKKEGISQGRILLEGWYWLPWPFFGIETVDMRESLIQLEKDKGIVVIAGIADNVTHEIPDIADEVDGDFSATSGVEVIEVVFEEIIQTSHELLEAIEKAQAEKAKGAGWAIDIAQATDYIEAMKKEHAIDPNVSMAFIAAVMGKPMPVAAESKQYKISGATFNDKMFGTLMAGLDAWRGKSGGGGGGKKGKKGGN